MCTEIFFFPYTFLLDIKTFWFSTVLSKKSDLTVLFKFFFWTFPTFSSNVVKINRSLNPFSRNLPIFYQLQSKISDFIF